MGGKAGVTILLFITSQLLSLGLCAFKWPLEPQDKPHYINDIIHSIFAGRYRKYNF